MSQQSPFQQTIVQTVNIRRSPGCLGGCAGIVGVVFLIAVIGAAAGGSKSSATPTPAEPVNAAPLASTSAAIASATVSATAVPTTTPVPTMVPQVVAIKDSPANVRESADQDAPVIATLDVGTQLSVVGPDVTGSDGATRWVPVAANGKNGFVRSDLVTERRAYAPATATPVPPTAVPNLYADYPLIDAADLNKRPDFYTGKRFSLIGEAFNVSESKGVTAFNLRAPTATGSLVFVAVGFSGTSSLVDGNKLRVYGVGKGTFTGKNGFGATVTQPLVEAISIGPPTTASNVGDATAYGRSFDATGTALVRDANRLSVTATALSGKTDSVIATTDAVIKSSQATSTARAKP